MTDNEPLTTTEAEIVHFIEHSWLLNGRFPEISEISIGCTVPESSITIMLNKKSVKDALENRGVDNAPNGFRLSPIQLAVANAMLDFTDARSEKKKLDDLGVTSKQYQGWRRNPVFANYMQSRAESLLANSTDIAHLSLVDAVRAGDVGAIKLHYEITGRYSSKSIGDMNVQYFMVKVLEAIQKHVQDPLVLQAIASEFDALSVPTTQRELSA